MDRKSATGPEAFCDLVRPADIVLDNFCTGAEAPGHRPRQRERDQPARAVFRAAGNGTA